jgi:uncharacterized protein
MPSQTTNHLYAGSKNKSALYDLTLNTENQSGGLILFLHGFKSFKDWGAWPWLANELASQGHIVVKINFSHNGVGINEDALQDFTDLQAFAENNFTMQIADVGLVINDLANNNLIPQHLLKNITCIGHSMGGGTALLAAATYPQITDVVALNPVSDFGNLIQHFDAEQWQKDNVIYVANARTNQQMPLHYQLYLDYNNNIENLNIIQAAAQIKKGFIIYALNDETVAPRHSEAILAVNLKLKFAQIKDTGHTFGSTHPFSSAAQALNQVLVNCTQYLANQQ